MTIPDAYVPDRDVRLRLYRRLADIHDLESVKKLEAEFIDRFGHLPEPVTNILYQMNVKILAEQANLAAINSDGERLTIRFPDLPAGMERPEIPGLPRWVRVGKNSLWLNMGENWRDDLLSVLGLLAERETERV
jgi:transcription-repair coupling factor (superfamily II helicase)